MKTYPANTDYAVAVDGSIFRVNGGKARPGAPVKLKAHIGSTGYYVVNLHEVPHKVHRLLAETYISNPSKLPVVAHKDGNKLNNDIDNLYWASYKDNSDDALRHGTRACNSRHGNAVLNEEQVRAIRALAAKREPRGHPRVADIADQFGVSIPTIKDVLKRRTWFR
jgi:hypothetical protein